jgi:hypothetical protein
VLCHRDFLAVFNFFAPMVYTNQEAFEMLQIIFEAGSFSAAANLWQQRFPDRVPHSRKVFARLSRRIQTEGLVQPHHNKNRIVRRRVLDEKSADIIADVLINPEDSLRRREIESGV